MVFSDSETKKGKSNMNETDVSFSLSDFQSFKLDECDQLYISFVDNIRKKDFSFYFTFKNDVSPFMELIGQKVQILPDHQNQNSYIIVPKIENTLLSSNIFKQPKEISIDRIRNLIENTDINLKFTKTTFSEFKSYFDCSIPPGGIEYQKMKYQWEKVTPSQFRNFATLQNLIKSIESDILSEENNACFNIFSNPSKIQEIAFNVLLTLSLYDFDECKYFSGEIRLFFPILALYVSEYGENFDKLSCESELFNLYLSFFNKGNFCNINKPEKQNYVMPILKETLKVIEDNFQELVDLYKEIYISSPDFLADDFSNWFIDIFKSPEEIMIVWKQILTPTDQKVFLIPFLIAILLYVGPRFTEFNPISLDESIQQYNKIKKDIDMNDVLLTAYKIQVLLGKN